MVWGLCSTPWTATSAWHLKFKQYETLLAVMIQASSYTYFKARCFKPCAVNLLSSASEGVAANEEKD